MKNHLPEEIHSEFSQRKNQLNCLITTENGKHDYSFKNYKIELNT